MSVGFFSGANHVLIRSFRAAVSDVFADSGGFQPGFLQNHTVVGAEASAAQAADILSLHPDGPAVRIIKAHQKIDESGFTASCGAHNGNPLAGLYVQIKIFNQLL